MTTQIVAPIVDGKHLLDAGPSEAGAHRLESWRICKRKFARKYEAAERRGEIAQHGESTKDYLIIGSLVHLGRAHWYAKVRAWQRGEDPEVFHEPARAVELLAEMKGGTWASYVPLSLDIVKRSIDFYAEDAKRYRILFVEDQLRAMVGGDDPRVNAVLGAEGFLYTQRIDLAYEDGNSMVWIVDHKGTGRLSGREGTTYSLDGQMIGYRVLGKKLWGDRFGGVLAMLFERKVGGKFGRFSVPIAPQAVRDFKEMITLNELEIRQWRSTGTRPEQYPPAMSGQICSGKYGVCEFYEDCQHGVD